MEGNGNKVLERVRERMIDGKKRERRFTIIVVSKNEISNSWTGQIIIQENIVGIKESWNQHVKRVHHTPGKIVP